MKNLSDCQMQLISEFVLNLTQATGPQVKCRLKFNSVVGELYAKGNEGVPQDYSEACFRLHIATAGKGLGVMQKSAIEMRNECASHLAPELLFQTQERAQKWIEAHPKSL
jgi:hypothetical protein